MVWNIDRSLRAPRMQTYSQSDRTLVVLWRSPFVVLTCSRLPCFRRKPRNRNSIQSYVRAGSRWVPRLASCFQCASSFARASCQSCQVTPLTRRWARLSVVQGAKMAQFGGARSARSLAPLPSRCACSVGLFLSRRGHGCAGRLRESVCPSSLGFVIGGTRRARDYHPCALSPRYGRPCLPLAPHGVGSQSQLEGQRLGKHLSEHEPLLFVLSD